jgi:hypothetical protein
MGLMDHRDSRGTCIWCHEPTPCAVMRTRSELADWLKAKAAARKPTTLEEDHYVFGIELAAEMIVEGE